MTEHQENMVSTDEEVRKLAEQILDVTRQLQGVHKGFQDIEQMFRETEIWLTVLRKALETGDGYE
jgi:hypothetical protein